MDELTRLPVRLLSPSLSPSLATIIAPIIVLGLMLIFGGCTFRERVAYEDCVRAQCGGEGIDCELVIVALEPEPLGVRLCTRNCSSDADCPPDPGTLLAGRCIRFDSAARCFPSCETEYDCAIPLACDLEEGVCLPQPL